jgi:hypothetical protein
MQNTPTPKKKKKKSYFLIQLIEAFTIASEDQNETGTKLG